MHRYLTLALFIVLVLGGGTVIGFMTLPGAWYAGLTKPPFNPPNWIFAPVWTLLYIMVAVAGWRTWQTRTAQHRHDGVVHPACTQFHLVAGVFRRAHDWRRADRRHDAAGGNPRLHRDALARDRTAALLFTPYAAWVAFATLLNGSIWVLNHAGV